MHWPIFSLTLFIAVVLQITAGSFFPFADRLIRPDFLALLALFFALYAPRRHAPLAAWIIGFSADLLSLGTPGAFAFSFGLLIMLDFSCLRLQFYRSLPAGPSRLRRFDALSRAVFLDRPLHSRVYSRILPVGLRKEMAHRPRRHQAVLISQLVLAFSDE